eukprot:7818057-Pyramimonas_sp.AAC.1
MGSGAAAAPAAADHPAAPAAGDVHQRPEPAPQGPVDDAEDDGKFDSSGSDMIREWQKPRRSSLDRRQWQGAHWAPKPSAAQRHSD